MKGSAMKLGNKVAIEFVFRVATFSIFVGFAFGFLFVPQATYNRAKRLFS